MDANLVKRIAFAAVAIPVALGVVWFGGAPLAVLVALIAGLGARELFQLARHRGIHPFDRSGMAAAALIPLLVSAVLTGTSLGTVVVDGWLYVGAASLILLLLVMLARRSATEAPLAAVAVTVFGVLYTGALPTFLLPIRGAFPERSWAGVALVFFPLVVTWICDTAAMFGGRLVGGAKLAPTISPGKTRSGGIAGVLGGTLVAPIFVLWVFPAAGITTVPFVPAMLLALVLSVVGQGGDLAESLFKREAGVKDSSALIPGHGGVLDRFDSLYVVLPLAALGYRLLGVL